MMLRVCSGHVRMQFPSRPDVHPAVDQTPGSTCCTSIQLRAVAMLTSTGGIPGAPWAAAVVAPPVIIVKNTMRWNP